MMKAVLLLLSVVGCGMVGITMGAGIEEKCGSDFQKVAVCLNYATGKAATPTKDCCDSVKGIKDKDPECLCYIMEQTHKGNEQIKNMGIQEAKLLQLPSACSLTNASLSDCPSKSFFYFFSIFLKKSLSLSLCWAYDLCGWIYLYAENV